MGISGTTPLSLRLSSELHADRACRARSSFAVKPGSSRSTRQSHAQPYDADFLRHKLTKTYLSALGSDFSTRIRETGICHQIGSASIKRYDTLTVTARVECTAEWSLPFRAPPIREAAQRQARIKLAPLRKTLSNLRDVRRGMLAANGSYFAFMACVDNPSAGQVASAKMAAPS